MIIVFIPFIKKYLLKYYKKSYKSICHVKLKREYEKNRQNFYECFT